MASPTSPTLVPMRTDCMPEVVRAPGSATWPKVASEAQKNLPYANHVVLGDSASVDEGAWRVSTPCQRQCRGHGNTCGAHCTFLPLAGSLLVELSKLGPDVDALTLSSAGLEHACVPSPAGVAGWWQWRRRLPALPRHPQPCCPSLHLAPYLLPSPHPLLPLAGLSRAPVRCCCCPAACPG